MYLNYVSHTLQLNDYVSQDSFSKMLSLWFFVSRFYNSYSTSSS